MQHLATLLLALYPALVLSQGTTSSTTSGAPNGDANQYVSGLQAALHSQDRSVLASLLPLLPAEALAAISQGDRTIFAPSDAALTALQSSVGDQINDLLLPLLSYHVLTFEVDQNDTDDRNHTLVRTLLTGKPFANLPGNQSQVLVLSDSQDNGNLVVYQNGASIVSTGKADYENLHVQLIDQVFSLPSNISSTLVATPEASSFVSVVTGLNPELVTVLENAPGITLFIPINSAFENAAETLNGANSTTIANVLMNHVVNGTAVYSSYVQDGAKLTSAGGSTLSFAANDTGVFVMSGNAAAQIVATDYITDNGVVHFIDAVLLDTTSNPEAASSAAASASSVQATITDIATEPLTALPGFVQTDSNGNPVTSTTTTDSNGNPVPTSAQGSANHLQASMGLVCAIGSMIIGSLFV